MNNFAGSNLDKVKPDKTRDVYKTLCPQRFFCHRFFEQLDKSVKISCTNKPWPLTQWPQK